MKEIEAFARGYNELSKSIETAWGEESEEKHGGVVRCPSQGIPKKTAP